jgi:chromosome segregation ATPase
MKCYSRVRQIITGLLLAMLILPAQTAQAQFAVYDGANHATQLERMAQEAARWAETVKHYMEEIEHYQRMFDKAVQQVTSLNGILTTVDEQLARNKALIGTISSVGQTIRNLYQLERQIESMVTCRIRVVQSVWTRLKQGIFDPKPSEDAVAHIELLANQDAEFEQYMYLRELAQGRLANTEKKIKELEALLAAEMAKPEADRHGVSELNSQIADGKGLSEAITAEINDLTQKINAKMVKYGVILNKHVNFGARVQQDTAAWAEMTKLNDEVLTALDSAFDPEAEQSIDVLPDDEFEIFR